MFLGGSCAAWALCGRRLQSLVCAGRRAWAWGRVPVCPELARARDYTWLALGSIETLEAQRNVVWSVVLAGACPGRLEGAVDRA